MPTKVDPADRRDEEGAATAAFPAADVAVAAAVAEARAAWPAIDVDAEVFERRVAAALGDAKRVHGADLLLATACAAGNPKAIVAFEQKFGAHLVACARRVDAAAADDAVQSVRARLLVKDAGDAPPRIAAYDGRGPLSSWLRVVVTREVLSAKRKVRREVNDDDALLERATSTTDPEMASLKSRHRAEFREAFCAALADLAPRERNLLRHVYVDESALADVASVYGVHRATATRWLDATREKLSAGTRRRLKKRFAANSDELDSLIRLMDSQLDVGLAAALGSKEPTR